MKKKNVIILSGIALLICLCASGCSLFNSESYPIAGSWTLETTSTGGTVLGDGTFTVTYDESSDATGYTTHSYLGTGSLNGTDFSVGIAQEVHDDSDDAVIIVFSIDDDNSLSFYQATINSAGDAITGNLYSGIGTYSGDTGSFTASKTTD